MPTTLASVMKSLWLKLIEAHDRTWRNRRIPLHRRAAACQKLWEAAIREHVRDSEGKRKRWLQR